MNRPPHINGRKGRLNAAEVSEIRRMVAQRRKVIRELSNKRIGEQFGIAASTVRSIEEGRAYKWVR